MAHRALPHTLEIQRGGEVAASSVESTGSMKRRVKARAAGSTVALEGVGGSIVSDANHRAKVASAIINEADVISCTRHTGRRMN